MAKVDIEPRDSSEVLFAPGENDYTRNISIGGQVIGTVDAFTHHVWILKQPYSEGSSTTIEDLTQIVEGAREFIDSFGERFSPKSTPSSETETSS